MGGAGVLLIVHRTPVQGLELELMARAAFPVTMPIVVVNTPAEAYQAVDAHPITVALIEEAPDLIAFAAHADAKQAGLIVGWIRNGAPGASPAFGERLNKPVTQADLAALAARARDNRGS